MAEMVAPFAGDWNNRVQAWLPLTFFRFFFPECTIFGNREPAPCLFWSKDAHEDAGQNWRI